jgi:hypothetical protein
MLLAGIIYLIGLDLTDRPSGPAVQSFWQDDLTASIHDDRMAAISQPISVTFTTRGALLSQIWTLPVHRNFQDIVFDRAGYIYLVADIFARYDPRPVSVMDLFWSPERTIQDIFAGHDLRPGSAVDLFWSSGRILRDAVIGPDQRIYSLWLDRNNDNVVYLSVYEAYANKLTDLAVISETMRPPINRYANFLIVDRNGLIYGLKDGQVPAFIYNPDSNLIDLKPATKAPLRFGSGLHPQLSEDGYLYGATYGDHQPLIFAYNLISGEVMTHEVSETIGALVQRPQGGVYLGFNGEHGGLATFDAASGQVITLPLPAKLGISQVTELTIRQGKLYGLYWEAQSVPYQRWLFVYDPTTETIETLEAPSRDVRELHTGPDDQIYLRYADQWLATFRPGHYVPRGVVRSPSISPTAIVLTQTQVGDTNASVRALMCDRNNQVYGVLLNASHDNWLFKYDPRVPAKVDHFTPQVAAENERNFLGGTEIIALKDGRIAGGTNSGHVYIFDPVSNQTLDLGRPTTETLHVTALVQGHDELIYGSTSSYDRAGLFMVDPVIGKITNITLPVTRSYLIEALAVAPDGRIYAGVDTSLFVYDPATRQATLAAPETCPMKALAALPGGHIYIGCGNRLLAYDPDSHILAEVAHTSAEIAFLTVGADGYLYGSMFHQYTGRCTFCIDSKIFAYDPATQRMTNLGISFPTGPVVVTACNDGTVYGGSNTTDSNYMGTATLFAFRTDCTAGLVGTWDDVTWQADTPAGTGITLDVLDSRTGKPLLTNVSNGGSLRAINARGSPSIFLQATLSTADSQVTPVFKGWRVNYTFACQK